MATVRVIPPFDVLEDRHSGLGLGGDVNGGVKPRINGEQRVAEATTCRVERQRIASRQAALRLLRCAPAPRVTRRNPLTQVALMAGSRLPAVNDPLCENTAIQKVNPHILCSPLFGAFGSPSTGERASVDELAFEGGEEALGHHSRSSRPPNPSTGRRPSRGSVSRTRTTYIGSLSE